MSLTPLKRLGGIAATAAIAVAAAALPASALGAVAGETTLALNGPTAKALRASGVKIAPAGAAKGSSHLIVLPIEAGLAGSETTLLRHRGSISLQSDGGRKLRLSKLNLVLGARARVEAKVGGEQLDLFRVLRGGRRSVDPAAGTVTLAELRLKLTHAAAEAIAKRLNPLTGKKVVQIKAAKAIGTLSTSASGLVAAGTPAPPTTQKAAGCLLPSGAGPAPEDPLPIATRPPAATDITAATIDWQVRESFIRYIGTGEGTSVSGGATADPPVLLPGASAPLSYGFHFPFSKGWLDTGANPTNPADDTAAIEFSGGVRFLYSGHGIDLATSAAEIEIAGGKSRAIFAISEDSAPATRQVLVNLDLSHAGSIGSSGNSYTYERVPGVIPSGTASSVFAGFYSPGTEFGCFTVSFTTGS